jgi:GNAT-family acetyltransferase (TIGR03103 family)
VTARPIAGASGPHRSHDHDLETQVEQAIDDLARTGWGDLPPAVAERRDEAVTLDCGWGRLVFGQTFPDADAIANALRAEEPGSRDICLYATDPHVVVGHAPNELFLDPSHTYRLHLHQYRARRNPVRGVRVRSMLEPTDAKAVNSLYQRCGMVTAPSGHIWNNQRTATFTYLVAEDTGTGQIIGTVMGVDHVEAFADPEGGTSLWCLAVDPQSSRPGVGEALARTLAERYQALGRRWLDLSVMHDNAPAIALYEKLGFRRVPVYCIKRKNPINEPLFVPDGVPGLDELNPYARLIADEALRRGIEVEVLDAAWGELRLTHGGRSILTRESLSELTHAVAMSRCDDKRVTRRVLSDAGIRVPRGAEATGTQEDHRLLAELGPVVVKPARGEQGSGITVGVESPEELDAAVARARRVCPDVLIEEMSPGEDLRIVVIDHEVVAAAVRRPAAIAGDGEHTVEQLIDAQSRRRAAATGGESVIPVDDSTIAVLSRQGLTLSSVPAGGHRIEVCSTANLHTGGTIHDVTERLHPALADAAVIASRALDIPVTGLDLLVPDVSGTEYVMIEANERPGLANHEPQPTAEAFIDLLFPTLRRSR